MGNSIALIHKVVTKSEEKFPWFSIPGACENFYSFVLDKRKLTMQIKYENGCVIFVWVPKKYQFQQI